MERDIEGYLRQHEEKELLRFVAVGSVDDGKSTLIGRLLHDTHGLYEDQLEAVKRASIKGATRGAAAESEIDFSLFTDGLKAEREQGITIDVAYRYFSTSKRKFIIADTPGHVQYTRNMATGASTANVAIILIDARLGILPQSRRHAYIASLLGIPHLVVGVNKMDLRDWSQDVFEAIRAELGAFAERLAFKDVHFVPISALRGDNVVHPSESMPWWTGGTLLELLETLPISADRNLDDLRYPVQYVIRPDLTYRGFAGQIASGVVRVGDEVVALPSNKRTRVVSIDTWEGPRDEAFAPMSVSLRLADEIDVSRGDMLAHPHDLPRVDAAFEAMVVWMSERPLDPERSYLLKHTTQMVRARVEQVRAITDPETLEPRPATTLALNDIGRIAVRTQRPIFHDAYAKNRGSGAFVLIDSITNDTVAAGMIVDAPAPALAPGGERTQVSAAERRARLGQSGAAVTVALPSLEDARALAWVLERQLFDVGRVAFALPASPLVTEGALLACAAGGLVAIAAERGAPRARLRVGDAEWTDVPLDPAEERERLAACLLEALRRRGAWDGH
ncbi:MAG: sulfate adenylyltransferase subunit CysN [Deltaproteobacteria bacterium]|nr:sulfate adenylyltransferase subunit CysN [Deltaproteobacteria bacterium]